MNKQSKPSPGPSPNTFEPVIQAAPGGNRATPTPPAAVTNPKPTKAEIAAKSAKEAAERDRNLDLVLHRFAKLL